MRVRRLAANFLGFQATWLACVAGAASGRPMLGPLAAALWLSLHLVFLPATGRAPGGGKRERRVELRLLLAAAVAGYLLDGVLVLGGAMAFPNHAGPAAPTTPWMVALWAGFAATLRHSMNWARRRYALAAGAGALFGPLAYRAGDALGAISLALFPVGLSSVAVEWALAMPLLLWLRERLEGAAAKGQKANMDRRGSR